MNTFIAIMLLLQVSSANQPSLCVNVAEAELYERPDPKSTVTWKVFRYMPLREVGRLNEWVQVEDLDGKRHWISDRLVSSEFKCAVISDEFAYLRSGPGKSYAKKKPERGEKYLSFKLEERSSDWSKLRDIQGDEVWVYSELLWPLNSGD